MSAAATLRRARESGIRLRVEAGDLVLEGPQAPCRSILDDIGQYKNEIIELIGQAMTMVRSETEPFAVLLRSLRFGDLWLVTDDAAVSSLQASVGDAEASVPVLTFDELLMLRTKSAAELEAVLTVKLAMPGSTVVG